MRLLFAIDTLHGQAWYELFYFIAILTGGVLFLLHGKRRGYPMAVWSLIFSGGIVFFIAGTKLVLYDADEWRLLLFTGQLAPAASKSVLGGILFGTLGLWLARRITRFSHPVMDALAVGLPLAMAIQRVGCLMAGCCYGTPTEVPWGVIYSVHAPAFHDHLAYGWIGPGAAASLPVHPTQLYQVFLCLLIAIIVWRMRHFFRRPGSLFLFSVGLYLAARFVVEFWNSPETAWLDQSGLFALKHLQWLLLACLVLLSGMIIYHENDLVRKIETAFPRKNVGLFFFMLLAMVLWIHPCLTLVEAAAVEFVLSIVLFFGLQETLGRPSKASGVRVRTAYALSLLLIINLSLTGQKAYNDLTSSRGDRNLFTEITLGYGGLTNKHYHHAPELLSRGCNGPSLYKPVGREYTQGSTAFGAAVNQFITFGPYNKLQWGIKASTGHDEEPPSGGDLQTNFHDLGVSVKGDLHWVGLGLGIHAGSGMTEEEEGGYVYNLDHNARSYTRYAGSLRLFPYDVVYTEVRFNEALPFQNHLLAIKPVLYVLGTGLNDKSGSMAEIGTDFKGVFYIAGKAVIRNKFIIKAAICMYEAEQRTFHFPELSLTYRMLNKRWTAK